VVCSPEVRALTAYRFAGLTDGSRPYLHMYTHSNELEEVGIASLTGVNIESNPEMEALLGVSRSFVIPPSAADVVDRTETLLLHSLHPERVQPQGAAVVVHETGSHSAAVMTFTTFPVLSLVVFIAFTPSARAYHLVHLPSYYPCI
jgi:hypothetical protein